MALAVVKRAEIPHAWQVGKRKPDPAKVRLHKGGTLFFSVLAVKAMGSKDCRVLAEYDEDKRWLKFTVVDRLPRGIAFEDTFKMRIRTGIHNKSPIGMISIASLLSYIQYKTKGIAEDMKIISLDEEERSVTLELPSSDDSLN